MIPEFFSGSAPVTFLIGGTGAGKTELALNIAAWKARRFANVSLVDLDIVNPFFRVRKLKEQIELQSVNFLFPDTRVASGDIPGLPASAWGAVKNTTMAVVCDIGGGELGLRPLGRMKETAQARGANVFFVINPYRPDFSTVEEIEKSFNHMNNLSAMQANYLIANPNMAGQTSKELFLDGLELVRRFSEKSGIKIAFAVAEASLAAKLKGEQLTAPEIFNCAEGFIMAIKRYWAIPWQFGDVINY